MKTPVKLSTVKKKPQKRLRPFCLEILLRTLCIISKNSELELKEWCCYGYQCKSTTNQLMLPLRGDTKSLSQPLPVKAITVTGHTLHTNPYESTKRKAKKWQRCLGITSAFSVTHHICQNFNLISPDGERHSQGLSDVQNNTKIKVKGIMWETKTERTRCRQGKCSPSEGIPPLCQDC